ncbi:MAG: hypothetical protein ACRYGK_01815 [Janthinobacterium lividum]
MKRAIADAVEPCGRGLARLAFVLSASCVLDDLPFLEAVLPPPESAGEEALEDAREGALADVDADVEGADAGV